GAHGCARGRHEVEETTQSGPSSTEDGRSQNKPLALLEEATYFRAVAWIIARLAEALGHAHQRGILHRDIKPSNILLSAEGQPMLLDFNLAQSVAQGKLTANTTLGGTIAYMAPEHLRAMAARDPALMRQLD